MSALSSLLERLRRIQPPPGAAAGALAVPSAGDQLSAEVAHLFGALDEIARRREVIRASARSAAAETEATARARRHRVREAAVAEAEWMVAELLAERRAACERRAQAILEEAQGEAARVMTLGGERTPALTQAVVERVLEGDR